METCDISDCTISCCNLLKRYWGVRVWFSLCCTGLFGWFGAALQTFFLFGCLRETLVVSKVLGGFFFSSETVNYRLMGIVLMGPIESSSSVNSYPGSIGPFSKVQKNGQQSELNTDVARFTIHIKPVLQQIRLLTGLNMGVKTRNIAIQPVLQQCYKTSCTFFVARFSVPAVLWSASTSHLVDAASPQNISIDKKKNVLWNPG